MFFSFLSLFSKKNESEKRMKPLSSRCHPFKPYVIALRSAGLLKSINKKEDFQSKCDTMKRYQKIMSEVSIKMIHMFDPRLVYTFNNELHLVFFINDHGSVLYGGDILKLVTNMASAASIELNKHDTLINSHFEGSFYQFDNDEDVANYIVWRQLDCCRNNMSLLYKCLYATSNINNLKHNEIIKRIEAQYHKTLENENKFIKNGTILKKQIYYVEKSEIMVTRKRVIEEYFKFSDNFEENYYKYIVNKLL